MTSQATENYGRQQTLQISCPLAARSCNLLIHKASKHLCHATRSIEANTKLVKAFLIVDSHNI